LISEAKFVKNLQVLSKNLPLNLPVKNLCKPWSEHNKCHTMYLWSTHNLFMFFFIFPSGGSSIRPCKLTELYCRWVVHTPPPVLRPTAPAVDNTKWAEISSSGSSTSCRVASALVARPYYFSHVKIKRATRASTPGPAGGRMHLQALNSPGVCLSY